MRFWTRIRMFIGILVVIAIAAAGFFWMEYSLTNLNSEKARLESNSYEVAIDYAGIITKQHVEVGDKIKKDDPLFEVRSTMLSEALNSQRVEQDELLFSLTPEGNIKVLATNDGQIEELGFREGSYVPANTPIAKVNTANSLYVSSTFLMHPPDYARVDRNTPVAVTLPDNTELEGEVFDISLQRNGSQVETVVKSKIDASQVNTDVFSSGTPVQTKWKLKENSTFDQVKNVLRVLFSPGNGDE